MFFIEFSVKITRELDVYPDHKTYFHEDRWLVQHSSRKAMLGKSFKDDSWLGTWRIFHNRSTITKEQKSCDTKIKMEKCLLLWKVVINQNIGGETINYLIICRVYRFGAVIRMISLL